MVLLDAAKGCGTGPPDLTRYPADFVAISFYKVIIHLNRNGQQSLSFNVIRKLCFVCFYRSIVGHMTFLSKAYLLRFQVSVRR